MGPALLLLLCGTDSFYARSFPTRKDGDGYTPIYLTSIPQLSFIGETNVSTNFHLAE